VQERDKILHEVSEREERLQRERDAKEKLQKQIQVMNVDALFGFVWQVTLLIRVLVWYLVIFVVFSNIFHGLDKLLLNYGLFLFVFSVLSVCALGL